MANLDLICTVAFWTPQLQATSRLNGNLRGTSYQGRKTRHAHVTNTHNNVTLAVAAVNYIARALAEFGGMPSFVFVCVCYDRANKVPDVITFRRGTACLPFPPPPPPPLSGAICPQKVDKRNHGAEYLQRGNVTEDERREKEWRLAYKRKIFYMYTANVFDLVCDLKFRHSSSRNFL